MSSISDRIERMIKDMLDEGDGEILIVRNEMASRINVVPSQISYVLSTRFSNRQGYVTESRRGGGGGIIVKQVARSKRSSYLMHVCNALGESLSFAEAKVMLRNFLDYKAIDEQSAAVMTAAMSHRALGKLGPEAAAYIRASVFRNMLAALAAEIGGKDGL